MRVRHSPRARRLRLVLVPGAGPELVVPVRTGTRAIDSASQTLAPWLEHALARQQPYTLGLARPGVAWHGGGSVLALARHGWRRAPNGARSARGTRTRCRGRRRGARALVPREALTTLDASIERQAPRLGVAPKTVAVRDQRTRWGSCSSRGTLSFSWRLLLAPAWVLDDVVCHELCHLLVANHSRGFWRLFATVGRRPIRARGCARTVLSFPSTARPIASAHHEHDRLRETRRTFRLHVPDDYEFTRDVVEHWAAQHPGKLALVAVDPRGEDRREISFGDLARASRRVANALEGLGITAGERAFVMLPRIPEWYELLLGMFRHGVIPMPATTLCTARDIAQRIERAQATIAVVDDEAAAKLATVRDQCSSLRHVIVVGAPAEAGDERYEDLRARASDTEPTGRVTRADDPLLLYFTSGTVAAPKMVLHTHASMGAGHEITARFWQDLTPADLHWTFSDTGWAKAAWGEALRTVAHGRVGVPLGSARQARSRALPARARALRRDDLLRAADALPCLRAARSRRLRPGARAPHRLGRRAAQPGGHPRLARGDRYDDLRRLRADRDGQPGRQLPLPRGAPGLDGQADAGHRRRRRLGRRRAPRARRGGQHRARDRARAAHRPDAGLLARRRRQRRGRSATAGTSPATAPSRTRTATSGSSAAPTTSSSRPRTASARSRSSRRWSSTRPSWSRPSSASRTPTAPASSRRSSSWRRATRASDALARELQEHVKTVTAPYKYPREIEFVDALPKTISGKIRRSELRERS